MCGIIGYSGHRPGVPVVVEGLRRLEYRGYDSSGVCFLHQGALQTIRAAGKLAGLERKLADNQNFLATTALGHTRWATHGAPVERNAHPHVANGGALAIVHNGIIENYAELKKELAAKGYVFSSDTDTEVLANLIADCRKESANLAEGFCRALRRAHGAYAVCLISPEEPDALYAARLSAPLVLGVGTGEHFVASDVPAFLPYTRDVVFLEDGELVRISPNNWEVVRIADLTPVKKEVQRIQWDMQAAQKEGYRHFMLKEIFEQPRVVTDCLAGRVNWETRVLALPELDALPVPQRLHIVACGTSWNAGLWARHLFESWAGIPASVEIASEFRYRDVIMQPGDMTLVISQSGETADTLAALRLAKEKGCPCVGLCNVMGSSIAREAHATIFTQAGPEISVASTKAMCSQMVLLALMALYWAGRGKLPDPTRQNQVLEALRNFSVELEAALPAMRDYARDLVPLYAQARSFFYLGRGPAFPLALEGALKLKELSYIHAEGYAAGEMKHGPIALIDPEFPTFAVVLNDRHTPKTVSNIQEVLARHGAVIALVPDGTPFPLEVSHIWSIPALPAPLDSLAALPALQLFSYEMAEYLGKDVDQPRNLAKSVTVE